MQLGIRTGVLGRVTPEESARLAAEAGLDGVQIALDHGGIERRSPDELTPDACAQIRETYESRGLQVYALSAYTDLGVADERRRSRQVEHFRGLMPLARHLGTNVLVTDAGARGIGAYERAVETMRRLMPSAHEQDVLIALEPSYAQSICCSEKARTFIEEVGYNRLKVLIDPANILVYDSLDRMFSLLGEFILFGHAKDVIVDDAGNPTFPPAGQGKMDYHRYVELLLAHKVDTLIVEYVTPEALHPTLDFLRGVIAEVEGSGR